MMSSLKQWICDDLDVLELGLKLGVGHSTIQRTQTDNPRNILLRAYDVACKFYTSTEGSKEDKLDKFHNALHAIGKGRAVRFRDCSGSADSGMYDLSDF